MVLRLHRTQPWAVSTQRASSMFLRGDRATPASWTAERGEPRWEGSANLAGGFPGAAQLGGGLTAARITLTDRYLLVNEPRADGFAMPLHWIEGSCHLAHPGRGEAELRVFYRGGDAMRNFTIAPRARRFVTRGLGFICDLQRALHEVSPALGGGYPTPVLPNIALPWDQARAFEGENALWTGQATAAAALGGPCIACDVWLTTRSLIWGGGLGEGINRVPLTNVVEMTLLNWDLQEPAPAVTVLISDTNTGRYDLPFIFNLQTVDRNARERGAFTAALRTRGIQAVDQVAPWQPWHTSNPAQLPDRTFETPRSKPAFEAAPQAHRETSDSGCHLEGEDRSSPAFMSSWPVAPLLPPKSGLTVANAQAAPLPQLPAPSANLTKSEVTLTASSAQGDRSSLIPTAEATSSASAPALPDVDHWINVRRYEERAVGALTESLRVIDARASGDRATRPRAAMPSSWEQAGALAEIVRVEAGGQVSPSDVRQRRERLLTLGDVSVRVRTLIELFDGGYLSTEELAAKRAALVAQLSTALIPCRKSSN